MPPLRPSRLAVLCLGMWLGVAHADPRPVRGTYRNPALGFSIKVPVGLEGITGDEAGPERGVRIKLPSGGEISVFGEPNSLEWKTPKQGVRTIFAWARCSKGRQEVSTAPVGKIRGAKGVLLCDDYLLELFLAFRPGGGPIYWLRLETTAAHRAEDETTLDRIAATFDLIPWR